MEIVKCALSREEIQYSKRCRVCIKSIEPRNDKRQSKRSHSTYKIVSTAPLSERNLFLRRLKALKRKRKLEKRASRNETVKMAETEDTETSINLDELGTENLDEGTPNEQPEESSDKPSDVDIEEALRNLVEEPTPTTKEDSSQEQHKEVPSKPAETPIAKPPEPKPTIPKPLSRPQFQSSFEEYLKPILSRTAERAKLLDTNADLELNRKGSHNTYKSIRSSNNKKSSMEFETYYWLELPKPKPAETRKLAYHFENLVSEVKHMKLPNPDWKIKIMVHKQEMVSVCFSNKKTPEKTVNIHAKTLVCDVCINQKKISLLGAPVLIYNIKDLEILLDIVNDLDKDSPLVQVL